jgi:hypothetical protein
MCRCVELSDESALRLRICEQRCSRTSSQSSYISAGQDVGEYLIYDFDCDGFMNLHWLASLYSNAFLMCNF